MGKISAKLTSSVQQKIRNLTGGKLQKMVGPQNGQMQKQQFPYDLLNSPNYKQGIVCTAYKLNDRQRNQLYGDRNEILNGSSKVLDKILSNKTNTSALANIFLPHQKTVVDNHSFDYQMGKDGWLTTLQQKGLGGVVGQSVFGIIEEVTGGFLGDQFSEAIDKRTKLMFNDAEPRQMVYLNTFTFRNINDLIAFAEIYFLFTYLAYPQLDNQGGAVGNKINEIVNAAKKMLDGNSITQGAGDKSFILQGLEAITNFSVIKVPCVWKIQSFTKQTTNIQSGGFSVNAGSIIPQSTFGPAVITNVKFNKTPNSIMNTFRAFPNDPVQVEMEITFKELFPLRSSQVFDITN